jgi:hypothetical protein
MLRPADSAADERRFDAGRYRAPQRIDGSAVLLVDDTWTGSSAQSAAAALREAGADAVALVVIGRYINLDTALMVATMTLAAVSRTSRRSRRSAASAKANSRSSGFRLPGSCDPLSAVAPLAQFGLAGIRVRRLRVARSPTGAIAGRAVRACSTHTRLARGYGELGDGDGLMSQRREDRARPPP